MLEEPTLLAQCARHLTSRLPEQSRWWAAGWLVPLAVQVAHTIAVAPTYRVGSFDDDANYLMAAHVLASGGWLTSVMPNGATVVANYLPGYPLLLVPVVWLFGAALWPPRLLSGILVAALYPLLWAWMARRHLSPWSRTAVLVVLAINSVLATYSTMVMAEAPFLVVFVLTLLSLDRWAARPGTVNAAVAVVLLAYLVWLKEAGIGLAVGLVAYELWRRHWRRAAGVTLGVNALLLPGLVARWASGSSVVGDRYSTEIAHPGQGGLLHQLSSEAPHVVQSYLQNVLRQSLLPEGSPLPAHGPLNGLLDVVGISVPLLLGVGAVVWYGRGHRAELWMFVAYFAETLAYPYTNQRRVVLVLPLVTVWYVVGAQAAGGWVWRRAGSVGVRSLAALAGLAAVLVLVVPTAAGFTRNYLWRVGQKSSDFAGSPAVAFLRAIGTPEELVETSYRGSIAYFTGHRTGWTAETETTVNGPFGNQNDGQCKARVVQRALRDDNAKFLVVGDFNAPDFMDSPCLLQLATRPSTARALDIVRLLSTSHDQTSVFELLGPGTPQPGLVDWTAGVTPVVSPPPGRRGGEPPSGPGQPARTVRLALNGQGDQGGTGYVAVSQNGRAELTWYWRTPVTITQLSLGSVGSASPITSVTLALQTPARTWQVVMEARGPIGDYGVVPYLLARLRPGSTAIAVRVTALTSRPAKVTYLNAIGPGPNRR